MTVSGMSVFRVTASLCGRSAPLSRRTLTLTQPSLFEGTKMELSCTDPDYRGPRDGARRCASLRVAEGGYCFRSCPVSRLSLKSISSRREHDSKPVCTRRLQVHE